MDTSLVDYIIDARKNGLSDIEIKQNLLTAGWEAQAVEDGFVHAKSTETKTPTDKSETLRQSQRDFAQTIAISSKNQSSFTEQSLQNVAPATHANVIGNPALADKHVAASTMVFTDPPKNKKSLKAIILITLGTLVVLLLASVAAAYFLFFNNPQKIWGMALKTGFGNLYKTQFEASFNDVLPTQMSKDNQAYVAKLSGFSNQDSTDPKNLKLNGDWKASYTNGGQTVSQEINFIFSNNVAYLDVSKIPMLSQMDTQKTGWLKLDFNQLQSNSSTGLSDQVGTNKDLLNIFAQNNPILATKVLGHEKLNGAYVTHLQNSIDKQVLISDLNSMIDGIKLTKPEDDKAFSQDVRKQTKDVLAVLINKMQVNQFETWVGLFDFKIYKISITSSAPSLTTLNNPDFVAAISAARSGSQNSNDTKRLSDMQGVSSALANYFNDKGGYPDGTNGVPLELAPKYLPAYPTAPTPAEGTCTDYFNTYWYQPQGTAKTVAGKKVYPSYTLTFCFGSSIQNYKAGIAELTPNNLNSGMACPVTDPKLCSNSNPVQATTASTINPADLADKVSFDADFSWTASYSDFGAPQAVQPPASFTDVTSQLNNQKAPAAMDNSLQNSAK